MMNNNGIINNVFGVIMAGGGGTRFWPLSRNKTPKQMLVLSGKDYMINETVDRLGAVVSPENMFIVTNKNQSEKMAEITDKKINISNILSEPYAKNTAACIGYAAIKLKKAHGDGVMIVTPSDAFVGNVPEYSRVLRAAVEYASKSNRLVTIGIKPSFPATGYGYIRFERDCEDECKPVINFVEKPSLECANEYLRQGDYVWNSGIFIWKISVILEKIKQFLPDIYAELETIYQAIDTAEEMAITDKAYRDMQSISIDYGVMEKTSDISVIPSDFNWSDVGSWDMINVYHPTDVNSNINVGDTILIDCRNTTAYSTKRLVAAVGVDDLVIVETRDAILVCPKNRVQEVKSIVERLKSEGRSELL